MKNPAEHLRETLAPWCPRGLFRWDISGRALLVSDAPRQGNAGDAFRARVHALSLRTLEEGGLLYIDCPADVYAQLLYADCTVRGAWHPEWFEAQSLLGGMLSRAAQPTAAPPDEPLLRQAMLACAKGDAHVPPFLNILRAADAKALRAGGTESTRACAALLAHWLWTRHGIAPVAGLAACGQW